MNESTEAKVAQMESCEYLFLRELHDPGDNSLALVVEEAMALPETKTIEIADTKIKGGHPVEATEQSRLFEISWGYYVAYSVRNESCVGQDEYEICLGRLFQVYSRSRFLDYISQATFAHERYDGPLQHIGLYTESAIIDVVATEPPQIRNLRPELD